MGRALGQSVGSSHATASSAALTRFLFEYTRDHELGDLVFVVTEHFFEHLLVVAAEGRDARRISAGVRERIERVSSTAG